MNSVKLGDVAKYADGRIRCSELTVSNYVGTDNIRQGKAGKDDSQYVPTLGQTTAYKKGDILIANIRPYLQKIWFADNDGGSSADVSTIRVTNDKYSKKFVFYNLFQDEFFDFAMMGAKGSKMPRLDKKQVLDFPIADFALPVQKSIVNALSVLDKKIALNNKINAELEQTARLIYDYWFTQFDFPDAQGKPYKSSGGTMVYNDQLKRKIPEGWTVKEVGKVFNTELGGTPSTKQSQYWDGGDIPWVNSGEVNAFPVTKTELKVTRDGVENSAAKILPKHTVILSIVRHIRVSFLTMEASTNQSVVGIAEHDDLKYPYIYLSIQKDIPRLMSRRSGAQQPHINKDEVDKSPMVIPDKNTLTEFNKLTLPIFQQIENNALQNLHLEELRDWLLPMLMTGQVKVV